MGYTTDFRGQFELDKTLEEAHKNFLAEFSRTRRMKRHTLLTVKMSDPIRIKADLPVGPEGAYYVGSGSLNPDTPTKEKLGWDASCGQLKTEDIKDYNCPPEGQPGLWCQWTPSEDGGALVWDDGEKFYAYEEWIRYLINHFLKPWGYVVNGEVEWVGEDRDDRGKIVITANVVEAFVGRTTYDEEVTNQ